MADNEAGDSRDTLDTFLGKSDKGQEYTLKESRTVALRKGAWKYIPGKLNMKTKRIDPPELYNLDTDIGETTNVIEKFPEVAKDLDALIKKLKESKGIRNVN